MMPQKPKGTKQMPFTKDDYFQMLDDMLTMPGQTTQQTGNPIIDRLRMAAQKRKVNLPRTPRV